MAQKGAFLHITKSVIVLPMSNPKDRPPHPLAAYAARIRSTSDTAVTVTPAAAPETHADVSPEPVPLQRSPHWTGAKMAAFIDALAGSQSVAEAARRVGMSRQSAYRLRARLRDTSFDQAWEGAYHHGFDQLAQAVLDRAINGVEVPHFYQGEMIGTSRRYNENLTLALMRNKDMAGRSAYGRHGSELNEWRHAWDGLLGRIEDLGPEGDCGNTGRWASEDYPDDCDDSGCENDA